MQQFATSDPITVVLDRWRQQGIMLLPPLPEAEADRLFAPLRDRVSADFHQLYATTGGMAEGETDAEGWALWTPEQVVAEAESGSLFFGDFLIDSHLHALERESAEASSVYVWHSPDQTVWVADSIMEFFELYLSNPGVAVHGK